MSAFAFAIRGGSGGSVEDVEGIDLCGPRRHDSNDREVEPEIVYARVLIQSIPRLRWSLWSFRKPDAFSRRFYLGYRLRSENEVCAKHSLATRSSIQNTLPMTTSTRISVLTFARRCTATLALTVPLPLVHCRKAFSHFHSLEWRRTWLRFLLGLSQGEAL